MPDTVNEAATTPSAVTGAPKALLRLEGLALGIAALVGYGWAGGAWLWFAILFLAPDLSFLGYLAGPRVGAIAYNAAHVTLVPIALGIAGAALPSPLALQLTLIWLAHIGIDRAFGYGLKYAGGFSLTHLGRIGKTPA